MDSTKIKMKFELNKKYKLRGGQGWGMPVYLFDDGRACSILAVVCVDGEKAASTFRATGCWFKDTPDGLDLLPEEWVEPPKMKKLYAYRNRQQIKFYLQEGEYAHGERAPEYDLEFPVKEKE